MAKVVNPTLIISKRLGFGASDTNGVFSSSEVPSISTEDATGDVYDVLRTSVTDVSYQ